MKHLSPFKKLAKAEVWFTAFIATLSILAGFPAVAQTTVPEKVDVNINTGGGDGASGGGWYAQPWVWVVGVAVFIIIIIAITRSNSSRRDV